MVFGFIDAGMMPLDAAIARENFPLRMMGTVTDGTAVVGSLGMVIGQLAGGLFLDAFASYVWLYVGAWGIGIDAFLMALMFRPMVKERAVAASRPVPGSISSDCTGCTPSARPFWRSWAAMPPISPIAWISWRID